jgi:hypothetical protein
MKEGLHYNLLRDVRLISFATGIAFAGFFSGRSLFGPSPSPELSAPTASPVPLSPHPAQPALTAIEQQQASFLKLPVKEQLKAVLDGSDAFAATTRTAQWISSLSAEDFRQLAKDPKNFWRPYFEDGFSAEFSDAYFAALAGRWMEVDPEAIPEMKRITDSLQKENEFGSDGLMMAAARTQPEKLLAKLGLDEKSGGFPPYIWEAIGALGRTDFRRGKILLDGMNLSNAELRKTAETRMLFGLAEVDPLGAIALSKQMGTSVLYQALESAQKIGSGLVFQVVEAAEGKLDGSLPQLLLRYPDLATKLGDVSAASLSAELISDAERTTPENRARILADYGNLPKGARDMICAALADVWSREDPGAAARWALAHAESGERSSAGNLAIERVFLRWVNSDLDSALAWWKTLPPSPMRERVSEEASTYIAEAGRVQEAVNLFRPETAKNPTIVQHFAQILAERDPAAAGAWLGSVPPEAVNQEVVRNLMSQWIPRNPDAVGEWMNSLPQGGTRDKIVLGFVAKSASANPEVAGEWVSTIADPKTRRNAAAWVFTPWARFDKNAAREWLNNLPDLDPRWKARMLQ